jgi:hypothetical protein
MRCSYVRAQPFLCATPLALFHPVFANAVKLFLVIALGACAVVLPLTAQTLDLQSRLKRSYQQRSYLYYPRSSQYPTQRQQSSTTPERLYQEPRTASRTYPQTFQRPDPRLSYVGIPSSSFNNVYAEQENSQWCWAACIQMILNYYGVNVSQYDIVQRTYGSDPYGYLPNWAGSYEVITANLNNWGIDRNGVRYVVRAEVGYGTPYPEDLVDELGSQHPVLMGYSTGAVTGHAVVATGAGLYGSADAPQLHSIVVRDPRENTLTTPYRGRREYEAAALRAVSVYWYIRVQRLSDDE